MKKVNRIILLITMMMLIAGMAWAAEQYMRPKVEYSADSTMETEAITMTGKVFAAPDKERREQVMEGTKQITITRWDKKVVWQLMPDQGFYMETALKENNEKASHMILLDDNFATIVKAVKEGRMIYDNIRKFIKYLLTTNSGEVLTLFLAPLVGLPIPLLPIHLLWVNLLTDSLPALALSAEPAEKDIMARPPRHPQESIFAHGLGIHAVWVGFLMAAIVIFVQEWSIRTGHAHWQTMVFTVISLTQLGHVMAIRSEKESLFKMGIFTNKYLIGAVVLTFILQLATVYVPALNPIFKTEPLTLPELMFTLALSSVVFFAVEVEKWIKRRRR